MSLDPLFLTVAGNIVSRIIDQAVINRWKRLDEKKVEKLIEDYLKERRLLVQPATIEREIIIVLTGGGVIDSSGQLRLPSPGDRTLEKLLEPVWERVYKIISVVSEKVLDVLDYRTDNASPIVQHDYHGGTNQQWRLIPVSDNGNLFKIHSQCSGKVLDVLDYRTDNASPIVQYHYHGGKNQQWRLSPIDGTGEIFKIISEHSGKALDVLDYRTDNASPIVQYDYHGGTNQQWRLTRLK